MENQEIRQYLINFVEKTLNQCEVFTKVYGKDFVRKRLEENLKKGNVAKILQMSKLECLQVMALVDNIYENERKTHEIGEINSDNENIELDKSISNIESILFEKYVKDEIETALNTKNLS